MPKLFYFCHCKWYQYSHVSCKDENKLHFVPEPLKNVFLKLYFCMFKPQMFTVGISSSTDSGSRLFVSFEVSWCVYLCVLWLGDHRQHQSEQRAKFLVSQPHKTACHAAVSKRTASQNMFLWSGSVGDSFVCPFSFYFDFILAFQRFLY